MSAEATIEIHRTLPPDWSGEPLEDMGHMTIDGDGVRARMLCSVALLDDPAALERCKERLRLFYHLEHERLGQADA